MPPAVTRTPANPALVARAEDRLARVERQRAERDQRRGAREAAAAARRQNQ